MPGYLLSVLCFCRRLRSLEFTCVVFHGLRYAPPTARLFRAVSTGSGRLRFPALSYPRAYAGGADWQCGCRAVGPRFHQPYQLFARWRGIITRLEGLHYERMDGVH